MSQLVPLNPDQEAILARVGQCLAMWTLVEVQLGHLFAVIIDAEHDTAAAVLDGIVSFEARVSAIKHAAEWSLRDSSLLTPTIELLERARKDAKKRAEVAHFGLSHTLDDFAPVILPYMTFGPKPQKAPLKLKDIVQRAERFGALREDVHQLTKRLRGERAQPQGSL